MHYLLRFSHVGQSKKDTFYCCVQLKESLRWTAGHILAAISFDGAGAQLRFGF